MEDSTCKEAYVCSAPQPSSVVNGVVPLTVYSERWSLLTGSCCWSQTQVGATEETENRAVQTTSLWVVRCVRCTQEHTRIHAQDSKEKETVRERQSKSTEKGCITSVVALIKHSSDTVTRRDLSFEPSS